jgi:hypothetical protein
VPLEVLDRGSPEALARFPTLPRPAPEEELLVVSDDRRVWSGLGAWATLLWATRRHRAAALGHARAGSLRQARRLGWSLAIQARSEHSPSSGSAPNVFLRILAGIPWLLAFGASLAAGRLDLAVALVAGATLLCLTTEGIFLGGSLLLALGLAVAGVGTSTLGLAAVVVLFLALPFVALLAISRASHALARRRSRAA